TAAEYEAKIGWGHSTAEYAVEVARVAGVKELALTHHDPSKDDEQIDVLIERIQAGLVEKKNPPRVFAAAENLGIELVGKTRDVAAPLGDQFSALTATSPRLSEHLVLCGISDTVQAKFVADIANAEGIRVRHETDEHSIIEAVLSERPTLLVLEHKP